MSTTERIETEVQGDSVVAEQAGEDERAILCVHGLASQKASLIPLVETLAEHGHRAIAPDLRGHGESQGRRGRISRQRAVEDLLAWKRWLAGQGAGVRAIVGHSLGGFWAMAASEALETEAIAIVATPASIRRELSAPERLAYRLGDGLQRLLDPLGVDLRVPYQVDLADVLETGEAIQRAQRIELVQRSLPLANAGDLLGLDGTRMAGQTDVPALVAWPNRDRLVAEASTRALYEALAGPRRWIELEGPHECFFEAGGSKTAEELTVALEGALDSGE